MNLDFIDIKYWKGRYRPSYLLAAPIILSLIYYGLIASDYYRSEATFTIQSAEGSIGASPLASLLGKSSPAFSSERDAYAVQHYLLSRDVLQRLDEKHGFRPHYESDLADWVSGLSSNASFEEEYEYYQDRVTVDFNPQTGVTTLKVLALTPEMAQQFSKALLSYGEEMVNRLSERARLDSILFARKEVEKAEKRLIAARQQILGYQKEGEDINPEQSASAILAIRNELESELAKTKAELREVSAFMQPSSHKVVALKQRINSLNQQIENENRRLVNPNKEGSLSASIARFEPLVIEKEFAQQAYESALTSLELARVEASKQHRYLAIVSAPSLPDEATYPKRILGILTVIAVTLLGYGIITLVIAAVKEHAKI